MPNIILGVTGGIAAYKAADIASVLANEPNYSVKVIMTEAAKKIITPLTLATLSKNLVYDDNLEWASDGVIKHIELAKWSDLFVIAPCTANTIAKLANGQADNLLTSAYLALGNKKRRLICPAMNTKMWEADITSKNLEILKIIPTCVILPPEEGRLACGDIGMGKLPSTKKIIEAIKNFVTKSDFTTN